MSDLPRPEKSPHATGKLAYRQSYLVELSVVSFRDPQQAEDSVGDLDYLQFDLSHVELATPLPGTLQVIPLPPEPWSGPYIAVQDYNFGGQYADDVLVPLALVEALGSVEAAYAYLVGASSGNLHYDESNYVDAAGEDWEEEEEVPGAAEG